MSKRILILSDINSAHTQKWCVALAQNGFNIGVFSLTFPNNKWYEGYENISVFCPIRFKKEIFHSSAITKLKYLKTVPTLKKVIREFAPDIVHAHYATSYGLIGAVAGFHPYLISAWGSDLMDFPYKNGINFRLLKHILKKADRILATSKILADHVEKFTSKEVDIIPFGVDLKKFAPNETKSIFSKNDMVIGVVKSMEEIYAIDTVIKTFFQLNNKYPNSNLKLLLAGSGSRDEEYKQLVNKLHIKSKTVFTGRILYEDVVNYYNMIDIFVNVSYNESFGVSVLEASACELPVVVSKIGGLIEVVEENKTGLFVEAGSISSLCDALEKLIYDTELRSKMGKAGREFVSKNYDWKKSVLEMESIYRTFLK